MSQTCLSDIIDFLEDFAPLELAEDWDNVGLLLGDRQLDVTRGLTCLTVTPEVVAEAVELGANLIVSHHPMPFQAIKKITTDTTTGQMILELCRNDIAVYSPHTAFDSTDGGINQMIAEQIGLQDIQSLKPIDGWSDPLAGRAKNSKLYGVGRHGTLSTCFTCRQMGELLQDRFQLSTVKFCGDLDSSLLRVGIACGSAGQFLTEAALLGCDAFITGETSFHTCLEAQTKKVDLFLLGHYGSERFAVESLAAKLDAEFPNLSISASSRECDPIQYICNQ